MAPCPQKATTAAQAKATVEARLSWLFDFDNEHYASRPYRSPGIIWEMLCIVIGMMCCVHSAAVSFPLYWSAWTRDLAIPQGDKRHRRAMYIFIGTVMLFCMAFVTAYPVIPSFRVFHPNWHTLFYSIGLMASALAALLVTVYKTREFLGVQNLPEEIQCKAKGLELVRLWMLKNAALFFNTTTVAAAIGIPSIWIHICSVEWVRSRHNFAGPFFSYRCLYPGSGVSPLVPMLSILLGWYVWALSQTLRLRFSKKNRPYLPGYVEGQYSWLLYVSDEQIAACSGPIASCLNSNITSLLITHEVLKRFFPKLRWWPALFLFGVYTSLFLLLIFGLKFGSVDRFLWQPGNWPTWYDLLISAIAFPLIMIGLSGWLRTLLIWSSLKRGVLDALEQLPLRYAFTRLKGVGWIDMMRQGGLVEQWRDMARSTESLRQMIHDPELRTGFDPNHADELTVLEGTFGDLDSLVRRIGSIVEANPTAPDSEDAQLGLEVMHQIELCYARACESLLRGVLIPYWELKRIGPVEGEELVELPIKVHQASADLSENGKHVPLQLHTGSVAEEPTYIRVAEEFLAIRYLSLIRAVLVNMRRLLVFVSTVFVLTIVAWNSYPFQPRQWIDEAFTALLLLIGGGILLVFGQMHRNPILSRITDTNANELGVDFYLRILTFGAAPVLTWLAYQFPEVGGSLFRILQPGLNLFK